MTLFGKSIESLDELFVSGLKGAYYMENEIVEALPDLIETARSSQLKQALSSHLEETKGQVQRLLQVFEMHGVNPESESCPAIDGIIREGSEMASDSQGGVLDAAIVSAAQKVEHYEITTYGSLISWAKALGREDCASVLRKNLDEEKAADAKLTKLAEEGINQLAA
ncbi:ferritin-like domain-containing protein [Methylocystis heyeri]|uniref:DUF892 family protein n=1 Tax=Methylocystis heyeri TaxID=391905 RepID=A0A6B8KFA9_9HYPH|nr:ferritin-like domain-containing protein [Methylocystis heyeri]QGM46252.1 DUF892 family protein [Methylocystis heyeri]